MSTGVEAHESTPVGAPSRLELRKAQTRLDIIEAAFTCFAEQGYHATGIADIATLGWVRNLIGFYEAGDLVGFADFPRVAAWLERGLARPAVQRGLNIPARS